MSTRRNEGANIKKGDVNSRCYLVFILYLFLSSNLFSFAMNQSQPLPPGLPPNFAGPPGMAPPNFAAPPPMEMIPQPVAPKTDLAVASTVVEGATTVSKIGLAPSAKTSVGTSNTATNDDTKKKGSSLVFSGDGVDEQGQELSMEEMRLIWFLRR